MYLGTSFRKVRKSKSKTIGNVSKSEGFEGIDWHSVVDETKILPHFGNY